MIGSNPYVTSSPHSTLVGGSNIPIRCLLNANKHQEEKKVIKDEFSLYHSPPPLPRFSFGRNAFWDIWLHQVYTNQHRCVLDRMGEHIARAHPGILSVLGYLTHSGTVLGPRLMTYHKSTRRQVQTALVYSGYVIRSMRAHPYKSSLFNCKYKTQWWWHSNTRGGSNVAKTRTKYV